MNNEKRRAKRSSVDVLIRLHDIQGNLHPGFSTEKIEVKLVNISKTGIAFRTTEKLVFNGFYDTEILFPSKDKFNAIVEIVRMEDRGESDLYYGCSFIGITSADQFKIEVYQLVEEFDNTELEESEEQAEKI